LNSGETNNEGTHAQTLGRRALLRKAARLAGIAGNAYLYTACRAPARTPSSIGSTGATPSVDAIDLSGQKIQLTLWHTQSGTNQEKLNAIIDAFNASQPSVRLMPEYQGNYDDLYKKQMTAISAGQMPELAVAYPNMVSEYEAANAVVALNPYVASSRYGLSKAERDDFISSYWNECLYPEFGNALLSFPFTKSLLVLYYNADRLQSAGVTDAPDGWTWDRFATVSKNLTDASAKGWAIAVNASTFDAMVYSRGGKLISGDQKTWLFNQMPGVESLALHQIAVREGWGYQVTAANADQNDFAAGRAWFTFGSTAGLPFYQRAVESDKRFRWNIAMIPHGTGSQPTTVLYGASVAVFKSNPEKQLGAWQFLRYFSSPAVTADWSAATGYLPVRTSALMSDVVQAKVRNSQAYGVAINRIAAFARPETSVRGTEDTRSYIEDAITKVITDVRADVTSALDDAARKGQIALTS
jgi:multiple sugar transport system substrate-binding protein